jgi:hypothetical protein
MVIMTCESEKKQLNKKRGRKHFSLFEDDLDEFEDRFGDESEDEFEERDKRKRHRESDRKDESRREGTKTFSSSKVKEVEELVESSLELIEVAALQEINMQKGNIDAATELDLHVGMSRKSLNDELAYQKQLLSDKRGGYESMSPEEKQISYNKLKSIADIISTPFSNITVPPIETMSDYEQEELLASLNMLMKDAFRELRGR